MSDRLPPPPRIAYNPRLLDEGDMAPVAQLNGCIGMAACGVLGLAALAYIVATLAQVLLTR